MAEQLDFAFEIFDPIESQTASFHLVLSWQINIDNNQLPSIPRLGDLPIILEKANRLARIDRYLSSLEEFASFFLSVQQLHLSEPASNKKTYSPAFRSHRVMEAAKFEASRARNKISHEQKLCSTYMKQFETLVQMVSQTKPPFLTTYIVLISCRPGDFLQRNTNYGANGSGNQNCKARYGCGWNRRHCFALRFVD